MKPKVQAANSSIYDTMKYPLGGCSTKDVNGNQSDCLVDLMLNAIPSLRCSITDSKG